MKLVVLLRIDLCVIRREECGDRLRSVLLLVRLGLVLVQAR